MSSPIDEIKARLDLAELIQSYVRLQKAGINYRANCPFHTEKTPSFFVSPTRQIWHCFGSCGKGGDHFKFIMEIEGCDFPEALRLLAQRTGVVLKREDPAIRSERNRLYDLCDEASKIFERSLSLTPAVRAYLSRRGVKDETVAEFRIGFAPQSWDFLLKGLTAKGFRRDEIEKAGLAIKSEDGTSWYDRFRSRIIFPVTDINSRVIGFGGRIFVLPEGSIASAKGGKATEDAAKYVNTPATLLYDKSRVLYGFDKAKQEIRLKNQVVLVEGYMDCIMSWQAGVKNVVAVSGTALTIQHLKNIKRLCDKMISSFDADLAGESATRRSLELAGQFEFERMVAAIPSGKDPADTVAENPKAWIDAVTNAKPVVEFYFDKSFRDHDSKISKGKHDISVAILPWIAELASEIEKSHWIKELARRLEVGEDAVWKDLKTVGVKAAAFSSPAIAADLVVKPKTRRELLEEQVLAYLAFQNELKSHWSSDRYLVFTSSIRQELFLRIAASSFEGSLPAPLEETFQILRLKGEILGNSAADLQKEFSLSLRELEKECIKDHLVKLGEEIKEKEKLGGNEAVRPLLNDFQKLSEMLKS